MSDIWSGTTSSADDDREQEPRPGNRIQAKA